MTLPIKHTNRLLEVIMQKFDLFSPFYYKGHVEETPLIQTIHLPAMIENYKFDPNFSEDWHVHSSYSNADSLPFKIYWDDIFQHYNKYINQFIVEYFGQQYEWEIADKPWYNVYGKGQDGMQHEHIDADFSVVHYLKFNPEVHSGTTFVNPNFISTKYLNILKKHLVDKMDGNDSKHSLYREKFTPSVVEGDMIIFPSQFEHMVYRSLGDDLRVIVAFNILIK